MHNIKKIWKSVIELICVILLLSACNRGEQRQGQVNESEPAQSGVQHVYCLVEEYELPDWEASVRQLVGDANFTIQEIMVYNNGALQWVVVFNDTMDTVTEAYIQLFSVETKEWKLIPTRSGFEKDGTSYSGIGAVFTSLEGDLYCFVHTEDGETKLATLDTEGVCEILGDADELESYLQQLGNGHILVDLSGKIYVYQNTGYPGVNGTTASVTVYDESLQKEGAETISGWMHGMVQAEADTEPYWYGIDDNGQTGVYQLFDDKALMSGPEGLAAREYIASYTPDGYLCLSDASALWVVSETGYQKVLSWQEHGYYWDGLYGMTPGKDGTTYLLGDLDGERILVSLTFTKEKPAIEKQEVVIALATQNTALNDVVAEFNRKNNNYMVRIMLPEGAENHTLSDNIFESQAEFRDKIKLELSAGRGPDILGDDVVLKPEDLVNNGYLEMLQIQQFYPEQQLEAVFESGLIENEHYGIPYDFTLDFAAYRSEDMEGLSRLTMEELMERVRQSDAKALQKDLSGKEIVVNYALSDATNTDYIDWENKVSHLTEEPFLRVLEFAKEYAGDGAKKDLSQNEYFAIGYTTIPMYELRELKDLYDELEGDVQVLGYPGKEGMGCYVNARVLYVSSQSESKEGAMEFLKYLISEQAQTNYATHDFFKDVSNSGGFFTGSPAHFPVNRMALEALIQHEIKRDKKNGYEAGDGTFVYIVPPYTDEQLDAFRILLENAKPISRDVDQIRGIVYEELEPYFNGNVSAEQAAEKLDNRIQLFLDESS